MKQLKSLLSVLLVLAFLGSIQAQRNNNNTYDAKKPGYWILGLNAGLAYQSSDVKVNFDGWGVGLTLGKNLYYSPSSNLSFDLRGRLLYDLSYGLDSDANTDILNNEALNGTDRGIAGESVLNYASNGGIVFNNHRTEKFELALEGVINFEKLRREKNIHFALYGGIGIDWYKASIDQSNSNDGLYAAEYAQIAAGNGALSEVLDGTYETTADGNDDNGNIGFMPAIGFELGYWFTPKVAFGIGHKLTWAMNDVLDGQQWDAGNVQGAANDLHHYTNLNLKFILEPGEKKIKAPVITLVEPALNPYTTDSPNLLIRATIENVNSLADVRYTINGNNSRSFSFSPEREIFNSNVSLREGKNTITIYASNPAGEDQENLVVYYKRPERPYVDFTNPSSFKTVKDQKFNVEATVRNLVSDRGIDFTVNGRSTTNFKYDPTTEKFTSTIDLEGGNNKLLLSAKNVAGSAKDEVTIRFDKPAEQPSVAITKPYDSPSNVNQDRLELQADIKKVTNKNDISLKVNGRKQSNFEYRNGRLTANVNLYEGENKIRVEATNRDGSDYDEVIVTYTISPNTPPTNPNGPEVKITNTSRPSPDRNNANIATSEVRANINKVNYRGDIEFYVNNSRVYRFDFNEGNGSFVALATLNRGNNTVLIKAKNADGEDQDETNINYAGSYSNNTPPPPAPSKNPPRVGFTNPSNSYSNTDRDRVRIEARIDNVTSTSDIDFRLNGRRLNGFNFNPNNGRFEAQIELREGNNELELAARNRDGIDSDKATIRFKGATIAKPNVRISSPRNGATVDQNRATVQARIDNIDDKNQIALTQNGRRLTSFSFNPYNKSLSASIVLVEGSNTIKIIAQNQGGQASDQITVRYNKAQTVQKPNVEITSTSRPASTPTNPGKMQSSIKATIKNVTSKNQVKYFVNSQQQSRFNFDVRSGAFSAVAPLKPGINRIKITAQTQGGSDYDEANITTSMNTPKRPATVKFVTPQNNSTSKVARVSIRAIIENVSDKRNISLSLNGARVSSFNYNKGILTAAINLKKGNNSIAIAASNNDGKDQASINVNYASATTSTSKPNISMIAPSKTGTTIKIPRYTVRASIKNVSSKSGISFLLNGKSSSNFNFTAGTFTSSVLLKNGKNTFKITAKNSAGSSSQSSDVTYKKGMIGGTILKKPTVEIISTSRPATTPMNPAAAKSTVKAKILNIKNKDQITFTVNGKAFKDFEFNARTGDFNIVANLSKGDNLIKIEAISGRTKAADEVNIKF